MSGWYGLAGGSLPPKAADRLTRQQVPTDETGRGVSQQTTRSMGKPASPDHKTRQPEQQLPDRRLYRTGHAKMKGCSANRLSVPAVSVTEKSSEASHI